MLKDKRRAALRIDFLHILAPSSPCGGQALPHSASSDKPSEPVLNQALLSQPASLCSAQHLTHHLTSALSPASKKHGRQQKEASLTPNPQTSCVYMHLRAQAYLHLWTGTLCSQFFQTHHSLHWSPNKITSSSYFMSRVSSLKPSFSNGSSLS